MSLFFFGLKDRGYHFKNNELSESNIFGTEPALYMLQKPTWSLAQI